MSIREENLICSAYKVVLPHGKAYILHESSTIKVIVSFLNIHDIRFYTSNVQNSEKQCNCVTRYTSVIGHVGCFDIPQGKKPVYLKKNFKTLPKVVYHTLK